MMRKQREKEVIKIVVLKHYKSKDDVMDNFVEVEEINKGVKLRYHKIKPDMNPGQVTLDEDEAKALKQWLIDNGY